MADSQLADILYELKKQSKILERIEASVDAIDRSADDN